MSFKADLNYGESVEQQWIKYLEGSKAYKQIFKVDGNFKHFDIIAVDKKGNIDTFEIKSDRKWMKTGNTVIEIGTKNDDSGVLASKATYLVNYLEGDAFYFTTIDELRKFYVKDTECRVVSGGDGWRQSLMIIPVDKLLKAGFKKVTDFEEFINK